MKQLGVAIALVFLTAWFGQGRAQLCACNDTACINTRMSNNPNTQECCQWVPQFDDTNPQSLNEANGTPLGFLLLGYRGTDSNRPDLCVRVNFETPLRNIRYIVAAVEAQQGICIRRRNPGPDDTATCGSNGVFFCESYTSGSTIEIEFYCNGVGIGSCPVNDEVFYLKPTVTSLDTDDEFYCDNFNRTLPSSLVQGEQPSVDPNPDMGGTGAATPLTSHLMPALLFVMVLVTTLVFH